MTTTESKSTAPGADGAAADDVGDGSAGDIERFGPWLRSQREMREISLEEIAESSKISKRYLEALEVGRFDVLPAGIFTKGFLRQYARYVGLDPEEVLSFYESARQELDEQRQEPEELQIRRPPSGPSNARWVLVALLLAVLMLAVVWGLDYLRGTEDEASARPPASDGQEVATVVPTTRTGPTSASAGAIGAAESADSGAADSDGAVSDAGVADVAGAEPGSTDPGSTDPGLAEAGQRGRDGAEGGQRDATSRAASTAGRDSALWVTIDFSDNCWVEAWADGQRRVAQLEVQGESLRLDADSEIRVKVGDVTAVRFEVNGMPYDPPAPEGGGVVQSLTFDLQTVERLRAAGR